MANMIPIQTVTVGSGGASSIDFTNIPQNYTDLQIKFSLRGSTTTPFLRIRFNGNSGSTYSYKWVYGTGSSAASLSGSADVEIDIGDANSSGATSNTFNNGEVYIPNYSGSNNKSISADVVTENNATSAVAALIAGLWANTSPVTSLSLYMYAGTFVQYSSATLYGIRKY